MNSTLLKNETQGFHDNVERVMNSSLLFSDQFTNEHYKHFIRQSYAYINTIIIPVTQDWPEYQEILTKKQDALRIDLSHIDVQTDVSVNSDSIKDSQYYRLGLIYIVLGAMLGNKMILKKLKEYPSFENYPFAYLSEHQDKLSEIWKNFQSTINQLEVHSLEEVIQGAKDGYSLFGK